MAAQIDVVGRYASLDLVLFLDMDIRTRERDLPHTNWENASDAAFAAMPLVSRFSPSTLTTEDMCN